MAVGKYQAFVKDDTIYAMDTESGQLYSYYDGFEQGIERGWDALTNTQTYSKQYIKKPSE